VDGLGGGRVVLGGEERVRTVAWLPAFQHAVVARGDAVAGRVDGGEVRTRHDCYGCEPANFEVERCNGADCAAADDEDILLAIVSHE
jgi:hypothetical protein